MGRDEGVLAKYISRVLGRLSVPTMQNSIKARFKIAEDEPVNN